MAKKKAVVTPKKMVKFTPEQDKILEAGLWYTWQQIGYDVMQSMQENEHRSTISRAEMLEVVCDAGYCKSYDRAAGELLDQLFDTAPTLQKAYNYLKKFFPHSRYC